jgi:hypothetical protein
MSREEDEESIVRFGFVGDVGEFPQYVFAGRILIS